MWFPYLPNHVLATQIRYKCSFLKNLNPVVSNTSVNDNDRKKCHKNLKIKIKFENASNIRFTVLLNLFDTSLLCFSLLSTILHGFSNVPLLISTFMCIYNVRIDSEIMRFCFFLLSLSKDHLRLKTFVNYSLLNLVYFVRVIFVFLLPLAVYFKINLCFRFRMYSLCLFFIHCIQFLPIIKFSIIP